MKTVDQAVKEDFKEKNPTRGYGGRYGTEQVMDKVSTNSLFNYPSNETRKINKFLFQAAEGWSYKADIQKHSSQTGKLFYNCGDGGGIGTCTPL